MDEIDVAEFNTREAARFSLDGLNIARNRAHALLLVMLAGGGGLGAVGLGQWASYPLIAIAALAGSAWWFAGAALLARKALASMPVRSWAMPGLVEKFSEWKTYAAEAALEGTQVNALAELRKGALRSAERAADEYREASTTAYMAIDSAYRNLAATPLVAAAAMAAACVIQRAGKGFLS
jgi:hypothetical protein